MRVCAVLQIIPVLIEIHLGVHPLLELQPACSVDDETSLSLHIHETRLEDLKHISGSSAGTEDIIPVKSRVVQKNPFQILVQVLSVGPHFKVQRREDLKHMT